MPQENSESNFSPAGSPPASAQDWKHVLHNARLYGIIDLAYVKDRHIGKVAQRMLDGGVDVVQFRAKSAPLKDVRSSLSYLRPFFEQSGVPLIINDYPALTPDFFAAGAHVGQDDVSVAEARKLAGPQAIVGKSTHSIEQAVAAAAECPDYIAFGPLYATATKPDYKPVGLQHIAEVVQRVGIPVFCIGGIKEANLQDVLAAGAPRVVIVSELLLSPDIAGYCRRIKERLAAHT